ncbi:MAG: murein biosynthesis integral membrane protein MurJ [Candidatus Omnitrophica bacterium]|nr:murein biosynthesis integral membrane protein MurJ [Candidatus Omnitrophota bacterium]
MSINKSRTGDSSKTIIRFTSVLSLGTLASRILGFVRDVLFARILGTGLPAEAFYVSFKIPNLLRSFVGEGAMNAALVPVFSEYHDQTDRKQYDQFVSLVFTAGFFCLMLLTLLGVILAPWLVRLIAPGFIGDAVKLNLASDLTRLMFPYLLFIGLTAYAMGYLYVLRRFLVPALSPCLLNISLILSALSASIFPCPPVYVIACGVLIGGLLQLLWHIYAVKQAGMVYHRPRCYQHSGLTKVGKLLLPRMLGSGVYQLTILIDTLCASLAHIVGYGGIAAVYYANRIILFPMGLFGVSMASAVLPGLSSLAAQNNMAEFKKTIHFSLKTVIWIMGLMTVLLLCLSEPIIRLLFERGAFDRYSTMITSSALFFYAFGLMAYAGIKILVSAFHALQDTKTPVQIAFFCLVLNAILNVVLMFPLKIGGIALASALASFMNFGALFYFLNKKVNGLSQTFKPFFFRVGFIILCTGLGVMRVWEYLSFSSDWLRLMLTGLIGSVVYESLSLMLDIEAARAIVVWIQKQCSGNYTNSIK